MRDRVKEVTQKEQPLMRIAMLGHKRIPSREGGIEIVVEELAVRMAAMGHEVTCYNRRGHHVSGKMFDAAKCKEYKGVQLRSVPTIDAKGFSAMSSSAFAALFAAFGAYDVVHFHAEGPCAMLWLPKLLRKKCVATIHGLDHRAPKWGRLSSAYIKWGGKCAAKYADELIVLNKSIQQYFVEQYHRETTLMSNGVSAPVHRAADQIRSRFGLEHKRYVLYLGRIVPGKGIEYLIEAFKECHTDMKLVIAGGASDSQAYMSNLREQTRENENIVFTDFVEGVTLQELYGNAYLYVLPSDSEGMPLSLLEAMSYGNCCLTSDIAGCTEVLAGHGVTFEKGNVADLREKLQRLLDVPDEVDKYGADAAAYILNRYSWDEVAERTLRLYQNIR